VSSKEEAMEGEEGALDMSETYSHACPSTYHVMRSIRLKLMYSLQLVEPRLAAGKIELCRFLHETELSVDVFELLGVAERMPGREVVSRRCPRLHGGRM
jgi:hypothetical protein